MPSRCISRTTSLPKARQPVVLGLVGRAVGPGSVGEVRQRHVARSQRIHLAQHRQAAADRLTAFHADQRGDLARTHCLLNFGGAGGKAHVARIARDQALGDVDLLERRLHGLRPGQTGIDIDRPELRADMAPAQPREVGLHRPLPLAGSAVPVVSRKSKLGNHVVPAIAQLLGNVVVTIPHRRGLERGLGDLFWRSRRRWGREGKRRSRRAR